jgi:hypothetical protein
MTETTRARLEPNGKCRSCHARVHWAHAIDGHAIPLDLEARENGNLEIVPTTTGTGTTVEHRQPEQGVARYVSHRVTCPMYAAHRAQREAQRNSERSGVKTYRNDRARRDVLDPWKGHW